MRIVIDIPDATIEEYTGGEYSLSEVRDRIEAMYLANLYEDVKWACHEIDEDMRNGD